MGATDQDKIVKAFRPALRSMWFLFFGLALGPAVMLLGRDPQGRPWLWAGLSLLCLGVILHRLSLKYTLTEKKIEAAAWWGRGRTETVALASLGRVRARSGLAGRLAGTAHLEITSLAPDGAGLNLLGQPGHQALIGLMEGLAAEAGRTAAGEADDGPG